MVEVRDFHIPDTIPDSVPPRPSTGATLAELIEPEVTNSSLREFQRGLFRVTVFDAFVSVFDLLRLRPQGTPFSFGGDAAVVVDVDAREGGGARLQRGRRT